MTNAPLIEAEGLHTFYGASHILKGIDFTVGRGETVGLMGRNGMGKTTLLRSLLGLAKPHRGIVRVNGRVVTGGKPFLIAREGIAFVPERRGIFPNLSVKEHLVMAARSGRNSRCDWTLDRVLATFPRLQARLGHRGTQLSGGEQQMLAIGRALMTNPDLLILDEATEGLAPLVSKEIWSIIHIIRESGIASIIVDKDHRAITSIADRNVILVKGHIALEATREQWREMPGAAAGYLGI